MLPIDQIVCGECSAVMADFPDECIDLTVTSPPYDKLRTYKGFTFDFPAIAKQLYRVTKPGGIVVWVVADATIDGSETGTSFRQALGFMDVGFKLHDTMIYHRINRPRQQNRYEQEFEYMLVLSRGKPQTTNIDRIPCIQAGRTTSFTSRDSNQDKLLRGITTVAETKNKGNVWYYEVGNNAGVSDNADTEHVATFPEKLAEDHILSWSSPGDLTLDPFVGSGTTPKMAIRHNRRFIGIDISAEYCELARKRISVVTPTLFEMT
jgi:DNA modification methylase